METNSNKNAMNEKKQRSKGAKIVLWILLGCFVANLVVLGVQLIIAICGGTGTSNGGILGLPWDAWTTVLGFFAVALVLAWLLTEPSFKKEEEVFEAHDIYQTYVKKVSTPRPAVKKEDEKANSGKPANEEAVSANAADATEDEGAKKNLNL